MKRTFFLTLLIWLLAQASAFAQRYVDNEYTYSEIITEKTAITPGETMWFALRQEVREGWHVFWKNPGEAGLTLKVEWATPEGFAVGDILYPTPEYIPVGPLASYAHEGAPVFLFPVTVPSKLAIGEEIIIDIKASWQACEEICVPEEGRFTFSMPVTETSEIDASRTALFDGARAALPTTYEGEATINARGGKYVLQLAPPADFSEADAFFFVETEALVEPAAAQTFSIADGILSIALEPGYVDDYAENTVRGVLTYHDDQGVRRGLAIEASLPEPLTRPVVQTEIVTGPAINLPVLLILAFFGGVILNVMPCVFPIVFIKATTFIKSAREAPQTVRKHGLLYTGGVLATFLAIGGVLLLLRASGEQLGWGFHLQSPAVVALSAYILFLVGLNLAGLFHVGESLAGSGEALTKKSGGAGAFFTGALAVVVAAPCIGPLLSAPMGAALLLPPMAGLAIFAVMGLGLAAPYLALSLAPQLGRYLPKPGRWMLLMKQALSFPVFGASVYFVWVLAQQTSGAGLAFILAGGVFLAFAAWLFELSKTDVRRAFILRLIASFAVIFALAPLTRLQAEKPGAGDVSSYGAMSAVAYSEVALDRFRQEGRPVFIDFTAAWCVTCQFNKLTIFSSSDMAALFDANDAVFMVADWTVRDPEITAALESFGASGVPLYVYYPKEGPAKVLPLPLTAASVRNAVLEN